jgi:hypothetical protein
MTKIDYQNLILLPIEKNYIRKEHNRKYPKNKTHGCEKIIIDDYEEIIASIVRHPYYKDMDGGLEFLRRILAKINKRIISYEIIINKIESKYCVELEIKY